MGAVTGTLAGGHAATPGLTRRDLTVIGGNRPDNDSIRRTDVTLTAVQAVTCLGILAGRHVLTRLERARRLLDPPDRATGNRCEDSTDRDAMTTAASCNRSVAAMLALLDGRNRLSR